MAAFSGVISLDGHSRRECGMVRSEIADAGSAGCMQNSVFACSGIDCGCTCSTITGHGASAGGGGGGGGNGCSSSGGLMAATAAANGSQLWTCNGGGNLPYFPLFADQSAVHGLFAHLCTRIWLPNFLPFETRSTHAQPVEPFAFDVTRAWAFRAQVLH